MTEDTENKSAPAENEIRNGEEEPKKEEQKEEKKQETNGELITVFHDPENFNVKHPLMHEWTLWFTKPPSGKVSFFLPIYLLQHDDTDMDGSTGR